MSVSNYCLLKWRQGPSFHTNPDLIICLKPQKPAEKMPEIALLWLGMNNLD